MCNFPHCAANDLDIDGKGSLMVHAYQSIFWWFAWLHVCNRWHPGPQRSQNYCLIPSWLAGVIGNLINSLAWWTWAVVTMHCWTPLWTLMPPIELRGCWDEMQQSRTFTALRLVPLCARRERGLFKFNHELSWCTLVFEIFQFRNSSD